MTCVLEHVMPLILTIGLAAILLLSGGRGTARAAADCETLQDPHAYNYCLAAQGAQRRPQQAARREAVRSRRPAFRGYLNLSGPQRPAPRGPWLNR